MRTTRLGLVVAAVTALSMLPATGTSVPTAPRPVTLAEAHGRSTLIVVGWPSPERPPAPCGAPLGYWQVHGVLLGDHALEGKIIPIYDHRPPDGEVPLVFGTGGIDFDTKSTILFLTGTSACPALATRGAQASENDHVLEVKALSNPSDCETQLALVDRVLGDLPRTCDRDADCAAFSLHPNSCERPLCLGAGARKALRHDWDQIAMRARRACAARWAEQPACAPQRIRVRCLRGQCIEGVSPAALPPMAHAVLQESCAPHDALSVTITIQPRAHDHPSISANVWGPGKPQRGGAGESTIRYDAAHAGDGVAASYCSFPDGCRPVRTLEIRLRLSGSGKGEVEFDVETTDGDRLRGTVPAEFGPRTPVLCG